MLWTILALACIVLGFVSAIIDERVLIPFLSGSRGNRVQHPRLPAVHEEAVGE